MPKAPLAERGAAGWAICWVSEAVRLIHTPHEAIVRFLFLRPRLFLPLGGIDERDGTEIFSLLLVAKICVAIGRQLNQYKRLTRL